MAPCACKLMGEVNLSSAQAPWPKLKKKPLSLAAINKLVDWLLTSLYEVMSLSTCYMTHVTHLHEREDNRLLYA